MGKQFLKNGQVELVNGGYLSTKEGGNPVSNAEYVKAQQHAEYVVTFATLAKGKDFVGKRADSLVDLQNEVSKALAAKKKVFVAKPTAIEKTLTKQLQDEAMAFMNFEENSSKVDKVNNFLQQFAVLDEFEIFGLFFESDIVKLNKLYTMSEVVTAVQEVIDLLK
tara:strand:+ start:132 stop:626 length:495 start_codon:yes stop_codon:yes gene_type:complete